MNVPRFFFVLFSPLFAAQHLSKFLIMYASNCDGAVFAVDFAGAFTALVTESVCFESAV